MKYADVIDCNDDDCRHGFVNTRSTRASIALRCVFFITLHNSIKTTQSNINVCLFYCVSGLLDHTA